jgi:hypothetical protein
MDPAPDLEEAQAYCSKLQHEERQWRGDQGDCAWTIPSVPAETRKLSEELMGAIIDLNDERVRRMTASKECESLRKKVSVCQRV